MTFAIAIIRYRRPIEEVIAATEQHRTYLRSLQERGVLVASGPMVPRVGGALILRVPDDGAQSALDDIRDGDPYVHLGLAQYEIIQWAPTIGLDGLSKL